MEIYATYYKTVQRDCADGQATFVVIPHWGSEIHAKRDHYLDCTGKIQHYTPGLPIVLIGHFCGNQFAVESDRLDYKTDLGIDWLLFTISGQYLHNRLTPCAITKITHACGGDLFDFCRKDDCIPVLADICKRSNDHEKIVRDLLGIIRGYIHQQEFLSTLRRYDVPYDRINKMIRAGVTLDDIRESPYIVLSRFDVPITIADTIARKECYMEDYARPRCLGYVYAALRYIASCGNTCCTMDQLVNTINARYKHALAGMCFGAALVNACILDMGNLCSYQTIDGVTYIYLNATWAEESAIVHHVRRLKNSSKRYNTAITVDDTAAEIGIVYNDGQRQAFRLLDTGGLKILTGPPGSGKTATINGLIHNFEANNNGTVHLAATTGMAARVMHDATGRDTETAHAMLRVAPFNNQILGRDLNDPVNADLIIVDEISMIGVQLFSVLVGAARGGAIVLLVGDENQLQSVEYGNVLHDLIESGAAEVCRLTEILRQSGTICSNAARVHAGDNSLEQDGTFAIKHVNADNIQRLLTSDYDPTKSQIISPIKKGTMGTAAINYMIQFHINGHSPVVAVYGRRQYRLGDKVIMTKNNYGRGYINGDIGYIRKKYDNGDLLIEFAGGMLCITADDLCNMDLAYAITIHKSQGSEFQIVHIILPEDGKMMMTRRLLYTAITRAKKRVIIYNQGASLRDAIADRAEKPRITMLAQRLQKQMKMRW